MHPWHETLAIQDLCALLFATVGILTLMRDATAPAGWVCLAGSLAFPASPVIRLRHERASRQLQHLPMTPDRVQTMRHPMVRARRSGTAGGRAGGKPRASRGDDRR